MRAESTCSASRGSAFQPLQICRVRSSGIAARHPVHLVGTDAGLVAAREERLEPLAELSDHLVVDEPFLDDDEAVALEQRELLRAPLVERHARGRRFSGS